MKDNEQKTLDPSWGVTKKNQYIPFLGGRPYRGSCITSDEAIDLVIDLETTEDVCEFLERTSA